MCGGGGGGGGDASAWFRFLSLVLIKMSQLQVGWGCFARRPSFTLTLSDSIPSNFTTKIKNIYDNKKTVTKKSHNFGCFMFSKRYFR